MALSRWTIDTTHSSVSFRVKHMMLSKVRGTFRRWSGFIDFDAEDVTRSRVEVRIDAASIDTGLAERDAHLRSPDFLDVDAHPQITFESTRIERRSDGDVAVVGDLTIRGTTREVALETEELGRTTDPRGRPRIGFEARVVIDRIEFGLVWNRALESGGVFVGSEVEIELDVEASPENEANG